MKRILFFFAALLMCYGNAYSQGGNNCSSAVPFCGNVSFPNNVSTTAQTGPSYGCLTTRPNPEWFIIKTTAAGTMNFTISQSTAGGSGIDVDFIAWGPYSSTSNICNSLTGSCSGDHSCSGNIEDCSYSTAAVENMTLVSPAAGQYFMILITNYADVNGNITFNQTSGPPTDCSITCPSVTAGNGFLQTNGTNMPATIACSATPLSLIASNNTPYGNPITPAIIISFNSNANSTLQINWYENATFILCAGPVAAGCGIQIPTNTGNDIQFSTMSPSATNGIQFCETSTTGANIPYTITDAASGVVINTGTWVTDAACTTVTIPPGTITGVSTWSISPACPGCMTTTDWGFATFNPGVAPAGTYNICYSFDPPGTCATYTYCQNITVTNPNNPAWTAPAALCANAASINLNSLVTGTAGGTWSGTGVSGNTFNPATSGPGTFTVTYTLGSGSCSATQSHTITVNPVPVATATPSTQTICSGGATSIALTSTLGSTTFNWTVTQSGASGATASSGSSIAQTLTATGTTAGTVVYTITPTAGGCTGNAISVTITVNPKPTVTATPSAPTICSGSATSIALTSNVVGTTFAWTVTQSGVSGASASSGSSIVQTLSTTGATAGTAVYTITPTAGGCPGTPITVTVTVNPIPTVTATPTTQTICSGSATSIALTGTVAGTAFNWTVSQSGASGATAGSGTSIAQTLSATGATAGTVVYTITPSVGGCSGTPVSVTITVNPRPVATATPASQSFCSGGSTSISLSGNVTGTTFAWTVVQTGVSGATGGSGSSIVQTLSTTGSVAGTAVYTITPTAGGCSGTPITVTITVNPTPNVTATPTSQTICSGSATSIALTGTVASTVFNWTVSQSGASGAVAGSGSSIAQTLSATGTTAGTVVYTITPSVGGCSGTPVSVTITVNPRPTATATPSSQSICSGGSTGITLTSNITGTTFSWTVSQSGVSGATASSGTTIGQVLTATGTTAGTATYTITPSAGGCSGTPITVIITVNPKPVATATPASQTFCTPGTTAIALTSNVTGTTFNWTVVQTGVTGATAGSGTSIAQALSTTGTVAGTAVYTITPTAGTCTGNPITVTITVNPKDNAAFTYSSSTYCQTGADPSATITGLAGGTFTSTPAGLVFLSTSTGQIDVSASALNTYTVTYTTNGICPNTSSVNITISSAPSASFSYAGSPFCKNGTNPTPTFGAGASAGTFTATPAGLVFVNVNTGQINLTSSAAGSYTITNTIAASGGCAAATATFPIVINPAPVATATPASQTICSGSATSIALTSTLGATTYNWTVVQTGVSGASASSGSTIAQTLSTTGVVPGTAVYTITPTSGGCPGTPITVTITVNPIPTVTATPTSQTLCSGGVTSVALTSNVATATFNWTVVQTGVSGATAGSGTNIAQTLSATGSTTGTAVYTITPTAGGCPGTPVTVTITVNPVPTVTATPSTQTICSGSATSIALTSNVASATFSWTVSQSGVSGASAGGGTSVAQTLSTTGTVPGTATYTITPLANGCSGTPITVTITVNPIPVVTATPTSQTICSGSTTAITLSGNVTGTTFAWTVTQTGVSGATASSGTSIAQILIATGASTGTAVYTITPTANGCSGTPVTVTITVNPIPFATATPSTQTLCSGGTTSIALTSFTTGTTFSWTVIQTGVSGASAGSGTSIAQVLSATGTTTGTAVYSITPSANGCTGSPITVTITVNPIPVLTATPATQTICSGSATSITLNSNVTGTTYAWTVTQTGVTGASANSGSSITQTLTATGSTAGTAVYTATPTANGCSGTPVTITVTVNPTPDVTATPPAQTICSGTATSIALSGSVAGTAYNWTVVQSGVTGASNDAGSTIAQTLSTTGTTTGTAVYTVTPTANGCVGNPITVTATVNPIPDVTTTPANQTICSGTATSIALTSAVTGTTFSWTVSQTGASGAAAGSGNSINQTITATGTTPGSVVYTITPSANTCSSAVPATVTITVNPLPVATASPASQTLCDGSATSISLTSNLGSTTFAWTVTPTGVTGAVAGSGNSISQLLSLATSTVAGSVVYTITPTENGCSGTPITDTVFVNTIDIATFTYPSSTFCVTGSDPSATITGTTGGIFSANHTGLVLDSLTGGIDVSASTLGTYTITYHTLGLCPNSSSLNITITNAPSATFSYVTPACSSDPDPIPTFASGGSAGAFTATPSGLTIDVNTGEINLGTSTPGTYTITNTIAPAGGCAAATASSTFTVSPAATVNAGLNDTICQLGTATLAGTMGGSASSITWTSNGSGTFNDTTNAGAVYTPSAADIAAGSVVLTITTDDPTGSCPAVNDFMILSITPLDNPSFSYSGGTFCQSGANPVPTLTGVAGGIFSSSPGGLVFVSTATGEVNLGGSGLGTYSIVYTTNGPCPSADTALLTITTAPVATFGFTSSATAFCQSSPNPTPIFGAGASSGAFTATPAGLAFVSTATGEINLAGSTPGTYVVTNTIVAAGGCAAAVDSLTITINQPATADAGINTAICAGSAATIAGSSIGGSATSLSWTSSGTGTFNDNTLVNTTYTPSAADTTAGAVTLYITTNDPAGACSAVVDSMVLTLIALPAAPPVIAPPAYCVGSTVGPLTATSTGGSISWYSDAALTTLVGTSNPFTPTGVTGTTTFWVTETVGACVSPASQVTINFNPLPVADSSSSVVTSANCGTTSGGISGVTIISGQSPYTYVWQNASGVTVDTTLNLGNVGPGVYTLTITDANGCSTQIGGGPSFTVPSTNGVNAAFTPNPATGEKPLLVNFTNSTVGGVNYVWSFGTGDVSSAFEPSYTFTQLGNFTVCLYADNGGGCADTACTTIDVYINSVFVIPNVFTPNGDEVNDIFTVKNVGLETLDAEIYNRWGQKEYEWHTTNGGWDGRTASGVLAPDGTYYYIISAKGFDGKEYLEKGGFTLIR
ncbi:MAG: hypothetical protein JWP12_3752 [Bacteroidetes bacterium]|nr:hypothetical protein [Bacteroidota bacterium]